MKKNLIGAALVGIAAIAASDTAHAQNRMPAPRLPGYWAVAPRLAMPAINGASRLGWGIGRWDSMRRYGPRADPGRWPGLRPALGIRRW